MDPMKVASILLAAAAVLAAGCSLIPEPSLSPREVTLRDLAIHEAQWEANAIDDYTISITQQCFCPETEPLDVTVVDGVVAMVTRGGQPVRPAEAAGIPKTVPDLFAIVARAVDAAALTVAWDRTFGYPTIIWVDPEANLADEEFGIAVTAFHPAS